MSTAPGPHAYVAIALACVAIFLYTRQKLRIESSSFLILITILAWFELFNIEYQGDRVQARHFLSGFGHEALITVVSLMILARGLEVTNALQPIGHALSGLWRLRPQLALLATIVVAAALSMFLNNTPVVAAMMPLLVAVSLQAGIRTSSVLMPIGFATIVGGMSTSIGTSTNLLVVSVAADLGMREMQMFDFVRPVAIVGSVAIVYLWLIAPHLLPERRPPLNDTVPRVFDSRLRIKKGSAAEDKPLARILAMTKGRMRVTRVTRGSVPLARLPSMTVKSGDYLHASDTLENLKEYEHLLGAALVPVDTDQPARDGLPMPSDQHIAEVVITEGSSLERVTLESSRLLSGYGLHFLALHQTGRNPMEVAQPVTEKRLAAGDVILLQGSAAGIEQLKRSGQALVLDGNIELPRPAKATLALAIMAAVVLSAAFGMARISQAALIGVGLMLATRCLGWRDVQDALDRRIILVIVASLALGLALMATGAAELIAALYVKATDGLPIVLILSGMILLMALLTEIATNNAIAVLGTPIAIRIAETLEAPAEPFVLAVLFGANMSYLTPVGYQTNLLVMSAGNYQFTDFMRVGVPLQLIMWIGLSMVLPLMYDL